MIGGALDIFKATDSEQVRSFIYLVTDPLRHDLFRLLACDTDMMIASMYLPVARLTACLLVIFLLQSLHFGTAQKVHNCGPQGSNEDEPRVAEAAEAKPPGVYEIGMQSSGVGVYVDEMDDWGDVASDPDAIRKELAQHDML
jgi:hypothetical protein